MKLTDCQDATEIRGWLTRTASEFTLDYHFQLDDSNRIANLDITVHQRKG
jgi:hypothetical protein